FMNQAEKDNDVKAVVIEVDSPGGSVSASDQIYHRIEQYKKAHPGTPLVISQGGLAASGGYYVSCAGDYIFAQPSTLTGNIGVLMPRFNVSKLMDKWGVQETTITSTGATYKNAGSMFKPANEKDDQYIQDLADKAFDQFKAVVQSGRKLKRAEVDKVADGRILIAADAKSVRL